MATQDIPSSLPVPAVVRLDKKKRKKSDKDEMEFEDETLQLLYDIQLKLVNLQTQVNNVEEKVDHHIKICKDDVVKGLVEAKEDLQNIKNNISPSNLSTQQAIEAMSDTTNSETFESDKALKFEYIGDWGKLHRERRDRFYKSMCQVKQADIIESWIHSDNVYISRKHRPKEIKGESNERYKLRENYAISGMILEIEEKRINASEHKKKYEEIDSKIASQCDEISDIAIQSKLKELWITEVTKAEKTSIEYWNTKKRPWWMSRVRKDPYSGNPNKTTHENTDNPDTRPRPRVTSESNVPTNEDNTMDYDQGFVETYQGKHRGAPANHSHTRGFRSKSRGQRGGYNRGRSYSRGRGNQRGRSNSRARGGGVFRGNNFRGSNNNNNNNNNSVNFLGQRPNQHPRR